MKQYFGYPPEGDIPAKVGYRSPGVSPISLSPHIISKEHPTFEWGVVNVPANNFARSLLLNAFGTIECATYPEACECNNPWITPYVLQKFEKDIVVPRFNNKEIFKISQLEICDFVFDSLKDPEQVMDINIDIPLDSLEEVKEPELI